MKSQLILIVYHSWLMPKFLFGNPFLILHWLIFPMRQSTSCQNLNLMVKVIYLHENTLGSFYVSVTNIRLLILMLLVGYLPLLSKDESNVGWKLFHLISFLHGFNLHMNFHTHSRIIILINFVVNCRLFRGRKVSL